MRTIAPAICIAALVVISAQPNSANAQIHLVNTDDAYTTNDTGTGPTETNDRSDHVAIRNHPAPRKRIGYFKYDVMGIDPMLFSVATLSGTFEGSFDGDGEFTVYGLNDGETNTDDVADGSFGEANWTEGALSYSMGLGVDVSVPPEEVGNLGLDLTEVTQLGTIALADGEPIQSNATDLPLEAFLSADTNGVVTFLIADLVGDIEWRLTAREASEEDSLRLSFFPRAGDTDLNGLVELADLEPIRMNYRKQGVAFTDGDLNGDDAVTFADFRIWKTAWLEEGGALSGLELGFLTVPEPNALWIAGGALVACTGMRLRRGNGSVGGLGRRCLLKGNRTSEAPRLFA